MKTPLILLCLFISFTIKAQELQIYYDNRDNTVERSLGQPTVPLILAENAMAGFSTVNFTVSKEGKIVSIQNLLKSDNLFFKTAKDALEKSSGNWMIKPGLSEQTFQITFFITSERLDSLRKAGHEQENSHVPSSQYVRYDDTPKELTILPTINIVYKQRVYKREILY